MPVVVAATVAAAAAIVEPAVVVVVVMVVASSSAQTANPSADATLLDVVVVVCGRWVVGDWQVTGSRACAARSG